MSSGCLVQIANNDLWIALVILIYSESCEYLYLSFLFSLTSSAGAIVTSGTRAASSKVREVRERTEAWFVIFIYLRCFGDVTHRYDSWM